ncbi:MAG TPA: hypothetical protein EYN86_00555 [Planctomycetes bacterium]|jgi:hypothetical protein|nr:hypothetical protein [Planctomycetota bacterium]
MTPKKRHLLDILRDEQSRDKPSPSANPLRKRVAVPIDTVFRPKFSMKIATWVVVGSVVFFFSFQLANSSNQDVADTSTPAITAQDAVSKVAVGRFCVVARIFNSQNLELARKLGTKLSTLGYNVQLAQRKVSSNEVVFELYVGNEPSTAALRETLVKLQELTLDGLGGAYPFIDSQIKPLPKN